MFFLSEILERRHRGNARTNWCWLERQLLFRSSPR